MFLIRIYLNLFKFKLPVSDDLLSHQLNRLIEYIDSGAGFPQPPPATRGQKTNLGNLFQLFWRIPRRVSSFELSEDFQFQVAGPPPATVCPHGPALNR